MSQETLFKNLQKIKSRELLPGCHAQIIHTEKLTLAYWSLEKGALIPEHQHPHEQTANILEGELELTINGKAKRLLPGDIALIPGNSPHSAKVISPCRVLDVFCPVREDLK